MTRAVDEDELMAFVGHVIGDWGAMASAPLVLIGDQLGLYRAMVDGQPVSAAVLAKRTNTHERYIAEWLAAQAAGGYLSLDGDGLYRLEPEQAIALTDESSPACVLGGFEAFMAAIQIMPRLAEAFRSGDGIGWGEHQPGLFRGTARFFRPGYMANLVDSWLPALDGVVDKLNSGARVADVGCGFGHSTRLMADAFPASAFLGFDPHTPSIDAAGKQAADSGIAHQLSFAVATAADFPGPQYDLITFFDCLHDMGDPTTALRHSLEQLAPNGTVMIVEPFAGDAVEDNMNPLGRLFYSVSTLVCTPASLSESGRTALGAQAGYRRTAAIAAEAGFSRFEVATQTPFNLVYQAKR